MVNFGNGILKKHWKNDCATLSLFNPLIPLYVLSLLNSVGWNKDKPLTSVNCTVMIGTQLLAYSMLTDLMPIISVVP